MVLELLLEKQQLHLTNGESETNEFLTRGGTCDQKLPY